MVHTLASFIIYIAGKDELAQFIKDWSNSDGAYIGFFYIYSW